MKRCTIWLYRFNALMFCVVLSIVLAWAASPFWYDHHRKTAEGIPLPQTGNHFGMLYFDETYEISGTPFQRIGLYEKSPSSLWGQFGDRDKMRNLLFIEKEYASVEWLFPDQSNTIEKVGELGEPAAALYLEYRTPAQNGLNIAMTSVDGGRTKTLLSGIQRILAQHLTESGNLLVLYLRKETLHRARFNMKTWEQIDDLELSSVSPTSMGTD